MGYFVTRKTTFGALPPMQDFLEEPRDPFSSPTRWLSSARRSWPWGRVER